MMADNPRRLDVYAAAIILAVAAAFGWSIISIPGLPTFGDFTATLSSDRLISVSYPLWNPFGSDPSFEHLMRIPYRLVLTVLATALSIGAGALYKTIFLLPLPIAGMAAYFLVSRLTDGRMDGRLRWVASMVAGLFYMASPWFLLRLHQHALALDYALAPLVLLVGVKAMEHGGAKLIVPAALLLALSVTPHYLALDFLLLGSWAFLDGLARRRLRINLKRLLAVGGVFAGLVAFWLLPMALTGNLSPSYLLQSETLFVLSRNASPLNALRLLAEWNPEMYRLPANILTAEMPVVWLLVSFVPAVGLAALVMGRLSLPKVYFGAAAVVSLVLSTGSRGPLAGVYHWLVFAAPLSHYYGWLLKGPGKWLGLTSLAYAFLIGALVSDVSALKGRRLEPFRRALIAGAVLVAAMAVAVLPVIKATLYDSYLPEAPPEGVESANAWLARRQGDFKVTWLIAGQPFVSRPIDSTKLVALDVRSSARPTISMFTPYANMYLTLVYQHYLLGGRSNRVGSFLSLLGSRYLVVDTNDGSRYGLFMPADRVAKETGPLLAAVSRQVDLRLVRRFGRVYVYENLSFGGAVPVKPGPAAIVFGPLDSLDVLEDWLGADWPSVPFVFAEQRPDLGDLTLDRGPVVIDGTRDAADIALAAFGRRWALPLAGFVQGQRSTSWRAAEVTDPQMGPWHTGPLRRANIDNWDFDFDRQLVYVDGTDALSQSGQEVKPVFDIPLDIDRAGEYSIIGRVLKSASGGGLRISLDEADVFSVRTTDSISHFDNVLLFSGRLTAGRHRLRFENQQGLNAVNVVWAVPTRRLQAAAQRAGALATERPVGYIVRSGAVRFSAAGAEAVEEADVNILRGGVFNATLSVAGRPGTKLKVALGSSEREVVVPESGSGAVRVDGVRLKAGSHSLRVRAPLPNGAGETITSRQFDQPGFRAAIAADEQATVRAEVSRDAEMQPLIGESVAVTPGSTLWARIDAKTSRVSAELPAAITVVGYGDGQASQDLVVLGQLFGTNDWRTLSGTFVVPAGVTSVGFVAIAGRPSGELDATTWLSRPSVAVQHTRAVYIHPERKPTLSVSYVREHYGQPAVYGRDRTWRFTVRTPQSAVGVVAGLEAYDGGWRARGESQSHHAIPVTAVLGGFDLSADRGRVFHVEYYPQRLFAYGLVISLAVLAGCLALVWARRPAPPLSAIPAVTPEEAVRAAESVVASAVQRSTDREHDKA